MINKINEITGGNFLTNNPLKFFIHYFLAIILCSLDFKASSSGKGFFIQAPVWGFYFLSFCIASTQLLFSNFRIRELRFFILSCVSFIVVSSIVGYWSDQESWDIFTNVISFSVYATAAVFTLVVLKLCPNKATLLNNMKNVCLAFMVLHFFMVYFTGSGLDLSKSRYEYLSGATIPASAILAIGAVLHFGSKELLIAATNLTIILISVTRTQLAVIVGQIASIFLAAPTLVFRPTVIKKIAFVALLAISIIAIDLGAGAGLTNRWAARFTMRKTMIADPTALTRYAEVHFMFDQFTASFTQLLFGNGIAAKTKLTGPSAALAGKLVGMGSVTSVRSTGFGHNNHMSVLFVGGVLFGAPLLLLNFINGFQAFALMRRLFKTNTYTQELVYIGTWGSLIVIGMLAFGFLSGIYSQRADCLWYGIGTGMLYWARGEVKQVTAKALVVQ